MTGRNANSSFKESRLLKPLFTKLEETGRIAENAEIPWGVYERVKERMPTWSEIDQEVHKAHLLRTGAHSELQKSNFFFFFNWRDIVYNGRFPGLGFEVKSGEGKIELQQQDIISGNSLPCVVGGEQRLKWKPL